MQGWAGGLECDGGLCLARTVALAPLHCLMRRCTDPRVELELVEGGKDAGGSLGEAGSVRGFGWARRARVWDA